MPPKKAAKAKHAVSDAHILGYPIGGRTIGDLDPRVVASLAMTARNLSGNFDIIVKEGSEDEQKRAIAETL